MRATASIDQIVGDICDPTRVDKSSSLKVGWCVQDRERTIGKGPIMSGLVRMMEEKAKNLILEPFEKKMK